MYRVGLYNGCFAVLILVLVCVVIECLDGVLGVSGGEVHVIVLCLFGDLDCVCAVLCYRVQYVVQLGCL